MSAKPSFTIAVTPPLVVVTLSGPFKLLDWLRVVDAIPDAPGFEPGFHSLIDARAAHFDFMYADTDALKAAIGRHLERRGPNIRSAYVVGADVDYGVSRMVQSVLHDLPVSAKTFRSYEEAEAWLRMGGDLGAGSGE